MTKQSKEWDEFQTLYIKVEKNTIEKTTHNILCEIRKNTTLIKQFKKTSTVFARLLNEGETVTINGFQEQVSKDYWLVQETSTKHQRVLKLHEFEHLFEHECPIKGLGTVKEYAYRKTLFNGIIYEGSPATIFDSKKKTLLL